MIGAVDKELFPVSQFLLQPFASGLILIAHMYLWRIIVQLPLADNFYFQRNEVSLKLIKVNKN